MQPRYATLSSSGSSIWQTIEWWANPIEVAVAVVSTGGAPWQIEVTLDDPWGTYKNPSAPTSAPVLSFYPSSELYGSSLSGNSSGGATSQIMVIWQPIAAWRLTLNASSLGPATATVLQAGNQA